MAFQLAVRVGFFCLGKAATADDEADDEAEPHFRPAASNKTTSHYLQTKHVLRLPRESVNARFVIRGASLLPPLSSSLLPPIEF